MVDIDLDFSNKIVTAAGSRTPATQWEFKHDTAARIEVRFWRNGVVVELDDAATGEFAVKENAKFDGPRLAEATAWTKTGTGEETVYTFEPDFNTEAIADLLFADTNPNNDEDVIIAMSEILWIENGKKNRTQTIQTLIYHEVAKETDGTPLEIPSPETWLYTRIAALTRSNAQGHPNGRKQVATLTLAGVCSNDGTLTLTLIGALLDDPVIVTLGVLTADTAAECANGLAVVLAADADVIAAEYEIEAIGDAIQITTPTPAAEDGTMLLGLALGTTGLDEATFDIITAGAAPLTPLYIGQQCRYGNASPFRWFLAATITPIVWEEITAGHLVNTTTGDPQKLTISGTATNEVINISNL